MIVSSWFGSDADRSKEILTRIFPSDGRTVIPGSRILDRHSEQTVAHDFLPNDYGYGPMSGLSRVSNRINARKGVKS